MAGTGEKMTNDDSLALADRYEWGSPRGDLMLGIAISGENYPLDVRVAVRNASTETRNVSAQVALAARAGTAEEVYSGGPRPSDGWRIEPGALVEIVGWRIDEPPAGVDLAHEFRAEAAIPSGKALMSGRVEIPPAGAG